LGEQSLVLVASPQIADVDFTEPGRHNACSFIINNRNVSFGRSLKVHCASGGARWKTPLSC
jgi:hypothetical protein